MKLSEHFDDKEFTCKCGCGLSNVHTTLIDYLEKLHKSMDAKAIYVTSGLRCKKHNQSIGAGSVSMHILGGASDIQVQKKDGSYYSAFTICECAEKIGFSGIGVIDDITAHVDIRDKMEYYDSYGVRQLHWFGNERTGANYQTFKGLGEKIETKTDREIKVILEYEGHKFSGLLTEME